MEIVSNLSFRPDIRQISALKLKSSYFSRAMDKQFTVLANDSSERILKLGIKGKVENVSYALFNRQYLKEGIIED